MPCYVEYTKDGGKYIMCGKLGPHCGAGCQSLGVNLCDYPVGEGRTCDMSLCDRHAAEVAPNIHYCPGHYAEWEKFRAAGGVKAELENVVPFSTKSK